MFTFCFVTPTALLQQQLRLVPKLFWAPINLHVTTIQPGRTPLKQQGFGLVPQP